MWKGLFFWKRFGKGPQEGSASPPAASAQAREGVADPEKQKARVSIDDAGPSLRVATLFAPAVIPKYPELWGISPSDRFWEDDAAVSLEAALLPIADRGASSVIVDLSAMSRHHWSVWEIIDELWLRLAARGRALVLVYSDDSELVRLADCKTASDPAFAAGLQFRGLRAKCQIARSVQDAIPLALARPFWRALDDGAASRLTGIQRRFHTLIQERVGHLWKEGAAPTLPDAGRWYHAGVMSGDFAFPYGGLNWEFADTDGQLVLKYQDFARIAAGWGCRYEISAEETRLVESGLD
jgi:hypothetical protein